MARATIRGAQGLNIMASYVEKSIHGGQVTFKPKGGPYAAGIDITIGRTSVTIRNRKTINEMLAAIDALMPHLAELENE